MAFRLFQYFTAAALALTLGAAAQPRPRTSVR